MAGGTPWPPECDDLAAVATGLDFLSLRTSCHLLPALPVASSLPFQGAEGDVCVRGAESVSWRGAGVGALHCPLGACQALNWALIRLDPLRLTDDRLRC